MAGIHEHMIVYICSKGAAHSSADFVSKTAIAAHMRVQYAYVQYTNWKVRSLLWIAEGYCVTFNC